MAATGEQPSHPHQRYRRGFICNVELLYINTLIEAYVEDYIGMICLLQGAVSHSNGKPQIQLSVVMDALQEATYSIFHTLLLMSVADQ